MENRRTAHGAIWLALAFINLPAVALAAGPYIGGSGGQAWIDVSADEIESAFALDDGFVASDTTIDDTDAAWKAFIGYRFSPFLALEAGYVDLGQASFVTNVVSAPPPFDALTPFPIHGTAAATGYNVSALIGVPLGSAAFVFVKGGAFHWEADFTETIPGTGSPRVARTESDTSPTYGAGLELRLNRWVHLRAEWERFEEVRSGIGGRQGANVDLASAGLLLSF